MKDHSEQQLAEAISQLSCTLRDLGEQRENKEVLHRISEMERNIMSQLSEYTDRVNAAFDGISTSVDEIVASQTGIAADVAFLKAKIEELQSNPGPISSEDQALLDALEAKVNALTTKTAAVSTALKDLDATTEFAPVV